jgi:hypothetical protein
VQTASKEEFCSAQNPTHKNLLKFVQMHKSPGFRVLGLIFEDFEMQIHKHSGNLNVVVSGKIK